MTAKGSVKLFTVSYTSSASASLYKNYPIKQKYIQDELTSTPTFPQSYLPYSSEKYWFPFSELEQADENYIFYETGDEFTFDEKDFNRARQNISNVNKSKALDYQIGTRIVYNNEVYESVGYEFSWSNTGFESSKNPYKNDSIVKWRKTSDTSNEWIQYWYHPVLKRFFVLGSNPSLQSLPDSGAFQEDKWMSFTGDAREINLTNFTEARIKELSSQGLSALAAKTAVLDSDRRIMRYVSGELSTLSTVPAVPGRTSDAGFKASPTTVSVVRVNPGSEGEISTASTSLDQPQMVQYYKLSDGSISPDPARFAFDYRPNSVQYSNIGSEWTEIQRPNNSPLIDFKSFRLMKITFEFLIGDKNDPFTSCDEKIRDLRIMSTRPEPVIFLGFDSMFSEHLSYPEFSSGSGVLFAIADVSISSAQRVRVDVANQNNQITSGKINRATVNMTLQELPIETPILTVLPKIGKAPIVPVSPPGSPPTGPCKKLFLNNPEIAANPTLRKQFYVSGSECVSKATK